jgi:uncharacterized protein
LTESLSIAVGERTTSARFDRAGEPVAVAGLAHGANNDMEHPFFASVAEGMTAGGVSVLRFNFLYKDAGRRSPDRPPVLIETWRAVLSDAAGLGGGLPVVASGKSLGGRMASMAAAEDAERFPCAALVFFGYPLHPPRQPGEPRTEHLFSITVPMLFIQGTADPLARFDLVEEVVGKLEKARLHVIEGGDHSFRVRGQRRPDEEIGRELGGVAASFVREVVG